MNIRQLIADKIGWQGNVADGDAFVNAVLEFQNTYPGQFEQICHQVVAAYLTTTYLKEDK